MARKHLHQKPGKDLHLTYLSLRRARHRDYKGAHVPERANFSWRAEAEPYSLWASAGWVLADVENNRP